MFSDNRHKSHHNNISLPKAMSCAGYVSFISALICIFIAIFLRSWATLALFKKLIFAGASLYFLAFYFDGLRMIFVQWYSNPTIGKGRITRVTMIFTIGYIVFISPIELYIIMGLSSSDVSHRVNGLMFIMGFNIWRLMQVLTSIGFVLFFISFIDLGYDLPLKLGLLVKGIARKVRRRL